MAEKRRKRKKVEPKAMRNEPVELSEWQKRLAHVRENALIYGAVTAFVILCILIGITFNFSAKVRERRIMTQYASAVLIEGEASERLAKIEPVAQQSSRWNAEALYILGETAIQAREFDKAEVAMKQVREQFPESEYAPRAAAAIAFLAENRGETEAALAAYREVIEKWSGTFTARRLYYDVARLEESLGNLENAKSAYENQVEVFPDSKIAEKAQQALARLRTSNPGLFGEPLPETTVTEPDTLDTVDETSEMTMPEEADATEASEQNSDSEVKPAEAINAEEAVETSDEANKNDENEAITE